MIRHSVDSLACPHVTGVAALVLSLPDLSAKEVELIYATYTLDIPGKQGAGLVNARAAVASDIESRL